MVKIMNTTQLAEFYGVNRKTIIAWVKKGMPDAEKGGKRGTEWKFNTVEVARWKDDQAIQSVSSGKEINGIEEARTRKLVAEARIAEMNAAERSGQLVLVDDVINIMSNDYLNLKARLRTIPSRIVPIIVGETDPTVMQTKLLDEIDDTLTILSNQYYDENFELCDGETGKKVI